MNLLLLLCGGLWLGFISAKNLGCQQISFRTPKRFYTSLRVGSRAFFVEQQLLDESPRVAAYSLNRLNQNLNIAFQILPRGSISTLNRLKFFLLYGPSARGGGKASGFEFFEDGAPEFLDDIDRRWSNCLVCYCAGNYAGISDLEALKVVIHELAHAYHLGNYPAKQADILAAWKHAYSNNLYRNVTDENGVKQRRAYALTNQREYFAELSCIYFGYNNYKPANRTDLRAYDPIGYRMIEKLWGVKDGLPVVDSTQG